MRSFSVTVFLVLLSAGASLPAQLPKAHQEPKAGQTTNANKDSKAVPDLVWVMKFIPSDLTIFGKPVSNDEGRVAELPAFDSNGKRIGQYELAASCLAPVGAFHFRVTLRTYPGDPDVQFKQINLHLNDSTNPYGLGSINRDPWTKSEISIDGGVPIIVLSNDMADTGKDYQSTFLFSNKTEEPRGSRHFWVGQKSLLLSAHKLVVTQTLDDDRKVSFSFNPQADYLKEFLVRQCGTK